MRFRASLLASALLLLPAITRADSFNLSGSLADGGSFNGTLAVNQYGEAYVQGTYTLGSNVFAIPRNYLGEQLSRPTFTTVDVFPGAGPDYDLYLVIPDSTLLGYTGGNLCTLDNTCGLTFYSSFYDPNTPFTNFVSLTATPTPTPEPLSLALFGTGILALATRLKVRRL